MHLTFEEINKIIPPEYKGASLSVGDQFDDCIVVLDDDPTGCQTVYDVPVLFSWKKPLLKEIFASETGLCFILTNTRSMPQNEATQLITEVMASLNEVSKETGRSLVVVSRSDSTLRGHYPAEMTAIDNALNRGDAMHCLIPAFFQGGRYTYGDIHYVLDDKELIPAAETPFADDKVFGFNNSNLREYVSEKTGGKVQPEEVLSIGIEGIRRGGPEWVYNQLMESDSPVCIVNALSQSDLDVFAQGAWAAMRKGKRMLFRTAASFINSFAGLPPRDLLHKEEIAKRSEHGGLIIVGSHVPKSTRQLEYLLDKGGVHGIELDVRSLVKEGSNDHYLKKKALQVSQLISEDKDVVLYTSREVVTASRDEQTLQIGRTVSDALVSLVKMLDVEPGFIITKGGITSHDIATRALNIRRAIVAGQVLPGVPAIIPENSEFCYIIFPGNVGSEASLYELYLKLK